MTNTLMINNIKNVVINNLAVNEKILGEVNVYNDEVQANTFMIFTSNRIFYWHDALNSSKLRTKSYNLIKAATVSLGAFSIHFNDEVVKFLVTEDTPEYRTIRDNLSKHIEIVYPKPAASEKHKSGGAKQPKPDKGAKSLMRTVLIVLTVVAMSFLGTMGFIYGRAWFDNMGNNSGMTSEKLKEIQAAITAGEQRVFLLGEYKQTLDNYWLKIEDVYADVKNISPSNSLFDWDTSRNTFSNHLLAIKTLTPKNFDDKGPYFDIKNGQVNERAQQTYLTLKSLVDDTISGIDKRFSTISDLVRIKQSLMSLKDNISALKQAADIEIQKVQEDIAANKALIQQ